MNFVVVINFDKFSPQTVNNSRVDNLSYLIPIRNHGRYRSNPWWGGIR